MCESQVFILIYGLILILKQRTTQNLPKAAFFEFS